MSARDPKELQAVLLSAQLRVRAPFIFVATLLTRDRAGGLFFNKILDVTAQLAARDQHRELLQSLLSQLISREFPVSGRPLTLTVAEQSYSFERQEDDESQLFGFVDFEPLLTRLDPFSIVTLVLALLSERRVIFVSERVSVLSHCAQVSGTCSVFAHVTDTLTGRAGTVVSLCVATRLHSRAAALHAHLLLRARAVCGGYIGHVRRGAE